LDEEHSKWDQFELNKQKFNVATSYDELHYTTHLDHGTIPVQVKIKAEKIVQEILTGDNIENLHIREERGLIAQTEEGDEEEKYSSVIRK
jgi:PAB1-binding protein PBP1